MRVIRNMALQKQYNPAVLGAHSMKWLRRPDRRCTYVDTPQGIFTDALVWFRTREAWLDEYAGAVFERKPLHRCLADAMLWLRSAQTLALWLLPALLLTIGTWQAAVAVVVFFVAWQTLGPSLVNRTVIRMLRVLEQVILQALFYVGALSWLALSNHMVAVVTGLTGFVLLRWGVLRMVVRPLEKVLWGALYRLPVPDHVLRAVIVRAALHYRIMLADFAPIEESIVRNIRRR